ncbi:ankyrin repeat domain-containing protein [Derxia gummosa]|uniref:Ankyrin repeat domain-containing protein n=1 Tax=Derxia gummosa DSM 723 TaxID=1121388 RepID=A0A8B6X514_9BURK|nr:ankyrin repeat domain-containing protein [Derxia gummosa]
MATLPSLEQLLVSLAQALGAASAATGSQADAWIARTLDPDTQAALGARQLELLLAALDLDPADESTADAMARLLHFGQSRWTVVDNLLATGEATPAQLAWLVGGWIVAPHAGRQIALRQLQAPRDAGMPADRFWYAPVAVLDKGRSRVTLPVEQVLAWVDGLLDGGLAGLAARDGASADGNANGNAAAGTDAALLADWRAGRLPEPADLRRLFADDARLRFADPADAPAPVVIRRRLLIARAVQWLYFRLGELLDGARFDARDADRQTNHALQLFDLHAMAHNLTMAAARASDDSTEQDADFERRVPDPLRYGPFASVLPSHQRQGIRAALQLLERRFARLAPEAPLGNLLAYSPEQQQALTRDTADFLHGATDTHERLHAAKADLRNKPHWKRVELLTDFDLVLDLARDRDFGLPLRQMLARRAAQLADTPARELDLICVELAQRLDGDDRRHRADGAAAEVEALLARARANPAAPRFAPALGHFEALHAIALGDFARAGRAFDAALAAAGTVGIGRQRTLLAHDAFALRAGRPWMGDIEADFHRLVSYGLFLGKPADALPDFDSWAAEAAQHFRTELHWPYAGPLRREPRPAESMRKWVEAVSKFGAARDWPGLTRWLGHTLKPGKAVRDAHGDTLLTLLLATRATFLERARELEAVAPDDKALALLAGMRERWPELLVTVVRACPWLAGESDFALRTPLMLAAAAGDAATLAALLDAGAPADAQDALGRGALHAAVAGGSADCLRLLLARAPGLADVVAHDGASALHAAARLGADDLARELLAAAPRLAGLRDARGRTAQVAQPATA